MKWSIRNFSQSELFVGDAKKIPTLLVDLRITKLKKKSKFNKTDIGIYQ